MVKKLIYVVAAVVVFGGLLVGAAKEHQNTQTTQTNQANATQAKLNSLSNKVVSLQNTIKTDSQQATSQFNADKAALCNFITTHVNTKTVPVPSECTSNSL